MGLRDRVRGIHFFRHDAGEMPAPLRRLEKHRVADDIEFLLLLALHVRTVRGATRIAEYPGSHALGDRLAREREIEDQRVEITTRRGVTTALLDQKPGQRFALAQHDTPPTIAAVSRDRVTIAATSVSDPIIQSAPAATSACRGS